MVFSGTQAGPTGELPDDVFAGSASGVKGETAPRSARDRQIPKGYG